MKCTWTLSNETGGRNPGKQVKNEEKIRTTRLFLNQTINV